MLFVSPSRVFLVLLRLILCFLCPPSRVFLVLLRDTTSQGTREGRLPLKKPSSKETKRGAAALTGCVPYQRPLKEPSSKETKRGAAHRTQPLKKPSSKETKRGAAYFLRSLWFLNNNQLAFQKMTSCVSWSLFAHPLYFAA